MVTRLGLVLVVAPALGYIWQLHGSQEYHEARLLFTEGLMFGEKSYPWSELGSEWLSKLRKARSRIVFDANVRYSIKDGDAADVEVVAYLWRLNPKTDLEQSKFNPDCDTITQGGGCYNKTTLLHHASTNTSRGHLMATCPVITNGCYAMVIQPCAPDAQLSTTAIALDGEVSFENPTGYLPAKYFGYVLFEAAMCGVMSITLLVHVLRCLWHRTTLRCIHHLVALALVVGAVEAGVWLFVYLSTNASGVPPCCPFTQSFIAAMAAHAFRRICNRSVLLCAAQGVGTGWGMRTGFACARILVFATVYGAFLAMAIVLAVANAARKETNYFSPPSGLQAKMLAWRIPEACLELLCLIWVYRSAATTKDFLKATSQAAETAKLRCLLKALTTGIVVAGVYAVGVFASQLVSFLHWPEPLEWAKDVQPDLVALLVLLALTALFRPSPEVPSIAVDRMVVGTDQDDDDFDDDGGQDDDEDVPEDDSNRMPTKKPVKRGEYEGVASRDEGDMELGGEPPKRD